MSLIRYGFYVFTLCALLSGCKPVSNESLSSGSADIAEPEIPLRERLIVPGADFVMMVDLKGMRSAPVYQRMSEKDEDSLDKQLEKFKEAVDIGPDDIEFFQMSFDLDGVDFATLNQDPAAAKEQFKSFPFLGVFKMSKPISFEDLKSGMEDALSGSNDYTLELSGNMLRMIPVNPEEPAFFIGQDESRETMLFSVNDTSITDAVTRLADGSVAAPSISARKVFVAQDGGEQLSASLVFNDSIRASYIKALDAKMSAPNTQAMAMMIQPFRAVMASSLGFNLDETVKFAWSLEMDNETSANQALGAVSMPFGMIKSMFAQQMAGQADTAAKMEKIRLYVDGARLVMSMELDENDLSQNKQFID